MALKLRPTGLGTGIDKDGRLHRRYRRVGGLPHPRNARGPDSALVLVNDRQRPMTRADRVATTGGSQAQFQKSWDAWKGGQPRRKSSDPA